MCTVPPQENTSHGPSGALVQPYLCWPTNWSTFRCSRSIRQHLMGMTSPPGLGSPVYLHNYYVFFYTNYYNENQTDCYLLLWYALKAIDRVEYTRLFDRLRDRNMCPIVLRLLINMYINQKIQVKWNNVLSKQYSISNGVKQGGCLSPTLF